MSSFAFDFGLACQSCSSTDPGLLCTNRPISLQHILQSNNQVLDSQMAVVMRISSNGFTSLPVLQANFDAEAAASTLFVKFYAPWLALFLNQIQSI